MNRISSIDFVRGFVMIIMALDHTRDLIHVDSLTQNPTDLSSTSIIMFLTRWITHLCAPTFVFLSGASVFLYLQKSGLEETRSFLLKRGVWLIIVELTIVTFGLWFDIRFHIFSFLVIGAIGFGLLALAMLLKASPRMVGAIGLIIVFGHNLLSLAPDFPLRNIISPLFGPAAFPITQQTLLIIGYPPIPWLGIMLIGFSCGNFFDSPFLIRRGLFLKVGLSFLMVFIILRIINVYGDNPWTSQKDFWFTFLSFINVTKYPPSLLFVLLMLGIMFMLFAFTDDVNNGLTRAVTVFGKVPLFYFIVHFYLIHIILLGVLFIQGFAWTDFDFSASTFGRPKDVASGVGLGMIYLIWMCVVIFLYPVCKWYGEYKAKNKDVTWVKYL